MGEVPVPGSLDELIEKIFDLLGNKGLDELNENEVTTLKALMANYKSNPADWKKYALFDPMNYTRNLVSNGNGKFNLMVLCWGTGQQSSIHDHSAAHCIVKMLDGELSETRFDWPEQQGVPLNAKNVTKLHRDETT
jgi:cysteine dioxygenase